MHRTVLEGESHDDLQRRALRFGADIVDAAERNVPKSLENSFTESILLLQCLILDLTYQFPFEEKYGRLYY